MKRLFFAAILVLLVLLPLAATIRVSAQPHRQALILSSLEAFSPMNYLNDIESFLTNAGYNITFVGNTAVTVNLLTTQLNNYDVIIWRTNAYIWPHTTYWYVGEMSNQATLNAYSADIAARTLDNSNGILGVSADFFRSHFKPSSLANVKLIILISSMSSSIAGAFVGAGVKAVIDCYDAFSLYFNEIDWVTGRIVGYLANGYDVQDAVTNTVNPFINMILQDPLDSNYFPPVWYSGNATVTIV